MKKLLLGILGVMVSSSPVIATISCESQKELIEKQKSFINNSKIWKKIDKSYFSNSLKNKDKMTLISQINLKDKINIVAKIEKQAKNFFPSLMINKEILKLKLIDKVNDRPEKNQFLNTMIGWLNDSYTKKEINFFEIFNLFINDNKLQKTKRNLAIKAFQNISFVFEIRNKNICFGTLLAYFSKKSPNKKDIFFTDDINNKIDFSMLKEILNE